MGQTIAEETWEEAWLRGETEGELKASRRMLRRLLTKRFGSLPDALVRRIDNCANLDQLSAAVIQVLSLDKLEDLQL
jgi:hypothetical protein